MGESNSPPKGYVGGSILPQPSNRVKMKVYMGGGIVQRGGRYDREKLTCRGTPYADINFDTESNLYKIIFHIVTPSDEESMSIKVNDGELIIPVIVNEERKIICLNKARELILKNLFLFDEVDIGELLRNGQYFSIGTFKFEKEEDYVIPTEFAEMKTINQEIGSIIDTSDGSEKKEEVNEKPNIHKLAYGFSVRWIEQDGINKKVVKRSELKAKKIPEAFTPGEKATFDSLGFDSSFIKNYINKPENIDEFLDFWAEFLNKDGTNNLVLMYSRRLRDYIQKIKDLHTEFLQTKVLAFLRKVENPNKIDVSTQPYDEKDYYFFEEKDSPKEEIIPRPNPKPEAEEETVPGGTVSGGKVPGGTVPGGKVPGGEEVEGTKNKILEIISSLDSKDKTVYGVGQLLKGKIRLYKDLIKDNKTILSYYTKYTKVFEEVLELKETAYSLYLEAEESFTQDKPEKRRQKQQTLNGKLDKINNLLSKEYYTHYKYGAKIEGENEEHNEFLLEQEFIEADDREANHENGEHENGNSDTNGDDEDITNKTLHFVKVIRNSDTHIQQISDIPYIKVARDLAEKVKDRHTEYYKLFEEILDVLKKEPPLQEDCHNTTNNITYITGLVNIFNLFLNYNKDTIKIAIFKEMCKVYNPTEIDFLNGDISASEDKEDGPVHKKLLEFRGNFCKKKTRVQGGGFRKTRCLTKRRVSPRRKRT